MPAASSSAAPALPPLSPLSPLPEGSNLLHIGPPKTGSTALQGALHAAREHLREHGVVYPGPHAKQVWSVAAGLGLGLSRSAHRPRKAAWRRLLRQVDEARDVRFCLSHEGFGRLADDRVRRVVEELGGTRPHVLVVARRYDRLLPSQWQQRIKLGKKASYEEWLREILDGIDSEDRHRTWIQHDTAGVVQRWGAVAGPENLTVVVADEADPRRLLAVVEQLLGVPERLLQLVEVKANRSLSYPEVELVRRVNIALGEIQHRPADWHALVSRGLVPALVQRPYPAGEPRVPRLPDWAWDPVRELGERRVEGLRASGARIVGDLEDLRTPAERPVAASAESDLDTVSSELAVLAIQGVLDGAVTDRRRARRAERRAAAAEGS